MKYHHPRPSEEHVRRAHELAAFLLPALREVAHQCGWALTTHGSMERDLDMVLIPWREVRPMRIEYVMERFFAVCRAVVGYATWTGGEDTPAPPPPERKPHGRVAWSIHFGDGPYLDISAMPPPPELKEEPKGDGA